MRERRPVSAAMITRNAERHLERVLRALDWCEEIIVVDALSSDSTPEICRRLAGDGLPLRLFEREWTDYGDQRAYSVAQAAHDWILCVDSDEFVTAELRQAIESALSRPEIAPAGFQLERLNYFLDRPITFGGSLVDKQLRLFDRTRGGVRASAAHESITVDGSIEVLHGTLHHLSNLNVATRLDKLNRYSTLLAADLHRQGKRATWRELVAEPLKYALYLAFRTRPARDGWRGMIWAASLVAEAFFTSAKLWERANAPHASKGELPPDLEP